MRTLGIVDCLFLLLENAKQPMHVAGLCLFELPQDSDENFVHRLISEINTEIAPNFPFNQALYKRFFWKMTDEIQLHQHCHHHRLETGEDNELLTLISHIHERRLPRCRPLWSIHLIDNLNPDSQGAPRRFALYLKIHHAVADGVAAMRLFQRSLSHSATERNMLPIWTRNFRQKSSSFVFQKKSAKQIAVEQLTSIPSVAKAIFDDWRHQRNDNNHIISSFSAPKSILNQRIGSRRHLAIRAFDKQRFVQIAQKFQVSTNDVILAVCGHALRVYLLSQNALPKTSLVAFVPISIRTNDTAYGNQISFLPANLGTNHQDDVARLLKIHRNIGVGKQRFSQMTQAQIINYTAATYAWAGLNLATRLYPKKQAFNLIISNVPGEDAPLYLNGARLTGIYPASVLFDGQALNISFTNYQNRIDFGITACQSALPNIEQLPSLLEKALHTYELLAQTA